MFFVLYVRSSLFNKKIHSCDHFVSVFIRDSKSAVPVTKLSEETVFLNNFSKMRKILAVHALSPVVANEKQRYSLQNQHKNT